MGKRALLSYKGRQRKRFYSNPEDIVQRTEVSTHIEKLKDKTSPQEYELLLSLLNDEPIYVVGRRLNLSPQRAGCERAKLKQRLRTELKDFV